MLKPQIAIIGLVLLELHFSATLLKAQVISIDSKLASAKDKELVDQIRLKSWDYAQALLERLEGIDEIKCPSLGAFLHDVQLIAKQIDENTSPRQWPEIDTDKLITSNINFWKTMLELEPGDPGFTVFHISFLIAAGDFDRAHNLLHLTRQFGNWPSSPTNAIATLDLLIHRMIAQNGALVRNGIALHDVKEYAEAIKVFEEALVIWPGNANATYELGNSMRDSGRDDSTK